MKKRSERLRARRVDGLAALGLALLVATGAGSCGDAAETASSGHERMLAVLADIDRKSVV